MKRIMLVLLCLAPAAHAADNRKIVWDDSWPKFRTSEYIVTGAALAGAAANFYFVPPPKTSSWKGQIWFDKSARNTLLIHTQAGQDKAKNLSDQLAFPLIAYAMFDGPITARWRGGNKDAAVQLALINAETFAVTEVLNLTVSNLIPRRRPEGAVCDLNTKYDPHCVKSFWSGHEANAFAAASLVCAEHDALGLYGGKADTAACVASLVVASGVGVLRIAANDHHASDVLVGAAIGAATGYLLPNFLHFKFRKSHPQLGYLIPHVGPDGGGLTYVKTW